jgi:hypothetical protein
MHEETVIEKVVNKRESVQKAWYRMTARTAGRFLHSILISTEQSA